MTRQLAPVASRRKFELTSARLCLTALALVVCVGLCSGPSLARASESSANPDTLVQAEAAPQAEAEIDAQASPASSEKSPAAGKPAATESSDTATTAKGEETEAVRQGRQALNRGRSYPWYDASSDGLRRIKLRVEEKRETKNRSMTSPLAIDGLQIFAWALIVIVLVGLVAALILAYLRRESCAAEVTRSGRDEISDVDRVEALPFMAQRSPTDLLGQARAYYEAGNYREAIIYLFSHELVELDKQGLILLAKGKTNRQYLREVAAIDDLRQILQHTMVAFEEVFFGDHELTRADFEACWKELAVFERRLMEAVA